MKMEKRLYHPISMPRWDFTLLGKVSTSILSGTGPRKENCNYGTHTCCTKKIL